MQEIKKRVILLASVLKPVDEPRMYERMGRSLAANGYEVFIAGFPASVTKPEHGIHFLPHGKFKRLSIARIKVRFEILSKAFSIKPDAFVIATHELIGIGIIYRILTGRKIIYDVQENYWRNIMYTDAWPKFIRPVVAFFVRLKEIIASPFFSKFLLAEKCYESELGFTKGESIVIENKCKVPIGFVRKPTNDATNLVFTGTIAKSTGVFRAIDLTKKLHELNSKIHLTIIGRCAQWEIQKRVENEISNCPFITLIGGNDFVPHERIMQSISEAHFGIVFYPTSRHTENKIPSKLYEYLACSLPILLQNNKEWVELCKPYSAAFAFDFDQMDAATILKQMSTTSFYLVKADEANWSTEETKLIKAINSL